MTDPIADMLTRIRNAVRAGHTLCAIPFSRLKWEIAKKLEQEGYISDIIRRGRGSRKRIECKIAYKEGKPVLTDIKRKSRPGRRMYLGVRDVRPVRQGHGTMLLSTPQGVLTGKEARKGRSGGEALLEVW